MMLTTHPAGRALSVASLNTTLATVDYL